MEGVMETRSGKADERRKENPGCGEFPIPPNAFYEGTGLGRKASDTKSNVIGSQNGDEG